MPGSEVDLAKRWNQVYSEKHMTNWYPSYAVKDYLNAIKLDPYEFSYQEDLAISYQPQLHVQVDQGLPLRRIATLVSTPLNCLVVLADGPIKSIADLKGRKIGFSVGGFEDALLAAMLKKVGLSLNQVTLINVN